MKIEETGPINNWNSWDEKELELSRDHNEPGEITFVEVSDDFFRTLGGERDKNTLLRGIKGTRASIMVYRGGKKTVDEFNELARMNAETHRERLLKHG